jgi:hypothetical protein
MSVLCHLEIELVNNGNNNQAFPVLTSAAFDGSNTTIVGTLTSTSQTEFTLEFFANVMPNSSGYGEGASYLGSTTVTTEDNSQAAFTAGLPTDDTSGLFIAATASGFFILNTSAFSLSILVGGPAVPSTRLVAQGFGLDAAGNTTGRMVQASQPNSASFSPWNSLDWVFSQEEQPTARAPGGLATVHAVQSVPAVEESDVFGQWRMDA